MDDQALQKWWQGLGKDERADALRARQSGRVSEGLAASLRRAGHDAKPGDPVPGEVERFLKARH